MSYKIQFTERALDDLKRLFLFLEARDQSAVVRARKVVARAMDLLEGFPWSCRPVYARDERFRELVIPFGRSGYLCRFRIVGEDEIRVLGFRHQREEGYD